MVMMMMVGGVRGACRWEGPVRVLRSSGGRGVCLYQTLLLHVIVQHRHVISNRIKVLRVTGILVVTTTQASHELSVTMVINSPGQKGKGDLNLR